MIMNPQNPLKYVNINQFTRVAVTQPKRRLYCLDKEWEDRLSQWDKPGSQRGTGTVACAESSRDPKSVDGQHRDIIPTHNPLILFLVE